MARSWLRDRAASVPDNTYHPPKSCLKGATMQLDQIKVTLEGGLNYDFPRMVEVEQHFPRKRVVDIGQTVRFQMEKIDSNSFTGKRIAITVGSREIAGLVDILQGIGGLLRSCDAQPFIVPAMGSHGGATADGQVQILEGVGITEESIGMPILSSMETVEVARFEDGTPLYCDRLAFEADGIVICNKIKPHADFKGDYESGLVKMLTIGLAKHKGATALHDHGFDRFHEVLPRAAQLLLGKLPVLFGVAILENAFHELMAVEIISPEKIMTKEKELLIDAKKNIARLLLPVIDLLIIDEIGKNISGEGMDPNVTGRPGSGLNEGFEAPRIQKIVVLDVTDVSHGNGVGIGMADITTLRCVNQIDFNAMYTNAVTATILDPAKIPLVMNDDREALALALRTCNRVTPQSARVVRIKNTMDLNRILVSESCLPDVIANKDLSVISSPKSLVFDNTHHLLD